jgi:hypothetical protein
VRRRCRDPKAAFSESLTKIFAALDAKPGQHAKDVVTAVAGEQADEATRAKTSSELSFLIGEGYVANLPDGRLFAQPVLSEAKKGAEDQDEDEDQPAEEGK